ncbi:MAG: hypothetical protein ABW184_01800 [Sphingobium sp.]
MKFIFGGAAILLLVALVVWFKPILNRSDLEIVIEQMQKVCLVNVEQSSNSEIGTTLEAAKAKLNGGASIKSQEKLVQGALNDSSSDKSADDKEIRTCMKDLFRDYLKSRPAK